MKRYSSKLLQADGTLITLDIAGVGVLTADFSHWDTLVEKVGKEQISKVKLLGGDTLEFPGDIHVEVEDFITLARKHPVKLPSSASFIQRVKDKYDI